VAALTRAHVRPFLVDGTLLGAIREGDLLAHDKDVDLGILIEDFTPGFPKILQAAGFRHTRTFGTPEKGLEFAFRRNGIKLDTFFYYPDCETGELFHAAWLKDTPIRYGYPAFALVPQSFLGMPMLMPADPIAFLTAKYGDWKTPVTEWDWAWGPKNAVPWDSVVTR
jgi:hypothetical protein